MVKFFYLILFVVFFVNSIDSVNAKEFKIFITKEYCI